MNVKQIVQLMGGRNAVSRLTGVPPHYVSQMQSQHRLADHYLRFFIALRPELEWAVLLGDDYCRFIPLINDKALTRLRNGRKNGRIKHKKSPKPIDNVNRLASE
ncbi:hypothetical protein FVF58_00940 [Paraburkholderia panacisoli]|uniref:Uncharacterized protein n=1 Tax=Paraburkholderia panacisoli TaxID=2603818 RepID=A0A5B0HL22_9BURK|nr:hypothetical protein [Paraburkholderia panacisoli]KAA1015951.1 hypothetical protein FVF58_00940 [Paraburkholderia panacisoli]